MRYRTEIAPRRAQGVEQAVDALVKEVFTATEADIRKATVDLAPLRSQLGRPPAPGGAGTDVFLVDPYAPIEAQAHAGVLPETPEVATAVGTSPAELDTLRDQQFEMLCTYETVRNFDRDLAASENIVEIIEKNEQDKLIGWVRAKIAAGDPQDPEIIRLKSDAGNMLGVADEQEQGKAEQLKQTLKEKKAGEEILAAKARRTKMLDTMLALKNGEQPSQEDIAELYSTLQEVRGTGATGKAATGASQPAPAAAASRNRRGRGGARGK